MNSRHVNAALERADNRVQRAIKSRQPRFASNADSFYMAVRQWLTQCEELVEPQYNRDSRARDTWMSEFWMIEPYWAGVLNSICSINQNRAWTLTGGRNQVKRYSEILHSNTHVAPDQSGWRSYFGTETLSYYTADIGTVNEIGRAGRNGPLRDLWHTDPTRCKLSGNNKTPLWYYPTRGKRQQWRDVDYFRLASMLNIREEYNGLGFCATSRALELAKLMVAILRHDQEAVGARMPKGLLLLKNVREDQWNDALNARQDDLDGLERRYFGGVFVIASTDDIDGKLLALSQLPNNFDINTFTAMLMAGYALVTGYDPSEFWPQQFGALGRGTETEIQHMKATGKGGLEFVLAYQEALNRELPDTLLFEFEQRDDKGKLLDAEVAGAWADVAGKMYTAGYDSLTNRPSLATREQALSLMVDEGIIPPEWLIAEDDEIISDTERYMETPEIQRAIVEYPNDDIVRYHWPQNRVDTLVNRDMLYRRSHSVVKRQDALYTAPDEDFTITTDDVEKANRIGCERNGETWCNLINAEVE